MLNVVALNGRLGKDVELKTTSSGVEVATFSIACTRDFKNSAGERETDWFDVVAWRQTAKFCADYLEKGQMVSVVGRLQVRKYETKDGQKRQVTEVMASAVSGLGKASGDGESKPKAKTSDLDPGDGSYDDPFADED